MRTTLKAQAIRLIAVFLLITASTTTVKAQISQHPELYKVKEFHNYESDGGAYYCFTDAQYYQGKLYGVYINNNGPSAVCLTAFEVNGETQTMKQSTIGETNKKEIRLNEFGVYQDAEIIVYRNRFYVLWKNNTNGQIWIGEVDMKKGEYKKTRMLDDGKTYANFAATIYRDKICVILHRRTNKKLQVYQYGDPELNSGWDWCGTVRNAGHDNIELKGSTGISMEYDPDDHWDATSWYGYDDTEKKNVEKLIVGRLKSGAFEAFSYSGEYGKDNTWPSKWEEYAHHDIGRSKTFSLKLIQADIEGYAADNTNGYKASSNPLIFSYCSYDGKGTGEHFLKKFYPGSNSFAADAPIYTDLPYGYTAVATAADPTTETAPGGGLYYKQYIYLLRGNQQPYHWFKHSYVASIRSNEIVERRSSFNDEKALFGNSELRNLVRLVGIIEGPPPTVVDNNEWFGDLGVASSLAFTMGSGTSNSVSRLYKSDLKCSFGPHTDKLTAAFGGGYSFQKQHEEVTSQSESITVTFEANDTADYRAIALYSVPILTRCDLEYLSPTRRQSVRMPIFSYTYMTLGGCDFKIRRTRHEVNLQRLRITRSKGIALNVLEQVRRGTLNGVKILTLYAKLREAGKQRPGVGVLGIVEYLVTGTYFNYVARVHYGDTVGHVCNHAKVVRDVYDGKAVLSLQLFEQIQYLRLNGNVQRGGGFVAYQDFRYAGHCYGYNDPLPHTAGELMRILLIAPDKKPC